MHKARRNLLARGEPARNKLTLEAVENNPTFVDLQLALLGDLSDAQRRRLQRSQRPRQLRRQLDLVLRGWSGTKCKLVDKQTCAVSGENGRQ